MSLWISRLMYLIDTNIISELRKAKSGKADPKVVHWASQLPASEFFISVITLLELEHGVLLIERKDAKQGTVLRRWLEEQVKLVFEARILPVDEAVAVCCAHLHVPDPKPDRDALIAATAIVHGMTLVTRNVRDFSAMNVPVLNPWRER